MTRFIAVLGKGGVGKTTISVNLAVALHNLGKDVILMDANMKNPDVGVYLGVGKLPVTLSHVFNDNKSVFDSIYLHSSGVKLIPSDGVEEVGMDKVKNVFKSLNGAAEVVLVDTGSFEEEILDLVNEALIVTNKDEMSVKQGARIKKMAEEKGLTVLGGVLNRNNNHGLMIEDVELTLDTPVLVSIKESNDMKTASMEKQAVVNYYPRLEISKNFDILAKKIAGIYVKREGFFNYLMKGLKLK